MAIYNEYAGELMKIVDDEGNEWNSVREFWSHVQERMKWYSASEEHWDNQPATIDGVLNG